MGTAKQKSAAHTAKAAPSFCPHLWGQTWGQVGTEGGQRPEKGPKRNTDHRKAPFLPGATLLILHIISLEKARFLPLPAWASLPPAGQSGSPTLRGRACAFFLRRVFFAAGRGQVFQPEGQRPQFVRQGVGV